MALRRKGSAPWSLTKDTGLSDAPVSGSPFVEGDEVKPVIDAGYIDGKGLWQISPSDDLAFTFQDPNQALGAGASMFIEGINMMQHNILILGILDSSGNNININIMYRVGIAGTTGTPFNAGAFSAGGFDAGFSWRSNDPGDNSSSLIPILEDTSEGLESTWRFYKMGFARGTVGQMLLRSNEGANAGTISTAYMRLV